MHVDDQKQNTTVETTDVAGHTITFFHNTLFWKRFYVFKALPSSNYIYQ